MCLNKFERYLWDNLERLSNTGYKDENPRGKYKSDGEQSHSISIRGSVFEVFDISNGEFPITETRPIPWKSGINELLVIYQDQSNKLKDFDNRNCGWWSDWSDNGVDIGQRYGATVARYNLMNELLEGLENNPFGKRHLIDLYQYADLKETTGLHPCAFLTMFSVSKDEKGEKYLDLTLVQRSSDYLVAGTGINQLQYVALQMMIAKHLGVKVGLFEHLRKNVHIYDRHQEQVEETLKRLCELCKRTNEDSPKLLLNVPDKTNFYDIKIEDFELINYNPIKPQLKFDLAI